MHISLVCVLLLASAAVSAREPSHPGLTPLHGDPGVPPRDLRVLSDAATSGMLRLRFENLSLLNSSVIRDHDSHTYLLAGTGERMPTYKTIAARYVHYRDGRFVDFVEEAPPAAGPSAIRQVPVQITDVGLLRQYHVYSLSPAISLPIADAMPGVREFWLLDFIEIEVDIGPPPVPSPSQMELKAQFADKIPRLAELQILNPNIDFSYYEIAGFPELEQTLAWSNLLKANSSTSVSKLLVKEPGLYVLPVSFSHADTPRLFRRGEEKALIRIPGTPERLGFLARPFDRAITANDVYWLFSQIDSGAAPSRTDVRTSVTSETPTAATTCNFEKVFEQWLDFQPKLHPGNEVTQWFWKSVRHNKITEFELDLPAGFQPTTATQVSVQVYYGIPGPVPTMPAIELLANGIGDNVLTAPMVQGALSFSLSPELLRAGPNSVALKLRYPPGSGDTHDLLVQKIILRWSQEAAAPGLFGCDFTTTVGPRIIVRAPDSGDETLLLLDMDSDPPLVFAPETRPGGFLAFAVGIHNGPFRLVDSNALTEPRQGAVSAVSSRVDDNAGCDYLAVGPRNLLDAVEPLLERRRAAGLSTKSVDVETIFDEYGYGFRVPEAIKAYIQHGFRNWKVKPEYVLFVGESSAHKGLKDDLPAGTQYDYVPIMGNLRTLSPHGDHGYAVFSGNDKLADIAIGRLPVNSVSETNKVVAKFLRYEDGPADGWVFEPLFAMDDNEEFRQAVADITAAGTAAPAQVDLLRQWDYPYVPNFKVTYRRRSREATSDLIHRFHQGRALINFFGHGGPNLWSHERLLHIQDMPLLTNDTRLPLITCASCDNAWLDFPVRPVAVSMGELMVKKPDGGGIGLFGPVSGASPYEHAVLVRRLMEGIYRRGIRHIGQATIYASNMYFAETRSGSVPDQYVLIGDPALELKIPHAAGTVEINPEAVPADTTGTVAVKVTGDRFHDTTGTLLVQSITGNEVVTSAVMISSGGEILLPALAAGSYAAVYIPDRSDRFAIGRILVQEPMVIIGSPSAADNPSLPLFNPTRGHARNLSITLNDAVPVELADLAPETTTSVELRRPELIFPNTVTVSGDFRFPGTNDKPSLQFRKMQPDITMHQSAAAEVELQLLTYSFNPSPPVLGQSYSMSLQIANRGTTETTAGVVLLLEGDREIASRYTLAPVPPGRKQTIGLTPTEKAAGKTTLTVSIRSALDADSTAPIELLSRDIAVTPVRAAELEFVAGSAAAHSTDGRFTQRTTVYLHAELRNKGDVAARNISIHARRDNPTSGPEAQTINDTTFERIPLIEPGETVPVEFRVESPVEPGANHMFLIANNSRSVVEDDYSNNVIEVPPYNVARLGNIILKDFRVSPVAAQTSEVVQISFTAFDDGAVTRGPVDIQFGLQNKLTGREISSQTLIRALGNAPVTVTTDVLVESGYNNVFAEANASREFEEVSPEDNSANVDLTIITLLSELKSGSTYNLAEILPVGYSRNFEFLPGQGLRLDDAMTSKITFPARPDYIVRGHSVGNIPGQDTDNKWSVWEYNLQAHPDEKPEPLTLSIPGADTMPGVQHDVYVHLITRNSFLTGRSGDFDAQIEDGPLTSYNFSSLNQGDYPARCRLGRFDLHDGTLDITISKQARATPAIVSFELVPIKGLIESPILIVPEDAVGKGLAVDPLITHAGKSQIVMSWRTFADPTDAQPVPWTEFLPGETLEKISRYCQFKLEILPDSTSRAVVKDLIITAK